MAAVHFHVESADDPGFVWLRISTNPNPERKPVMLVARDELNSVVLMSIDMANAAIAGEAAA
jgi:hypothetical protein